MPRYYTQQESFWPRNLAWLAAFCIPFILFLETLSPDFGFRDSTGFIYRSFSWGLVHPTGYPLPLILGKLFTWLPFGDIAYRVNALSALFGALTCLMLYLAINQLIKHRFISVISASVLAASQTFWSQSIIAEVYTLNSFILVSLIYIWQYSRQTHSVKLLYLLFFVFGMGLGNHITLLLTLPAFLMLILVDYKEYKLSLMKVLLCFLFLILPLSMYLMVLLFVTQPGESPFAVNSIKDFVEVVSGKQFHRMLFFLPLSKLPDRMGMYLYFVIWDFSWPIAFLVFAGLIALASKWPEELALVSIMLLGLLSFTLNYAVADINVFFIPTYCLFPFLIAALLKIAYDYIGNVSRFLASILVGVMPLLPVVLGFQHFQMMDHNQDYRARNYIKNMLADIPKDTLFLYKTEWDWYWGIQYLQYVENWWDYIELAPYSLSQIVHNFDTKTIILDHVNQEITDNYIVKKLQGVTTSKIFSDFLSQLPTSRIVLLAEKNEHTRYLDDTVFKQFETLGIDTAGLHEPKQCIAAFGVKGGTKGSAEVRITDTFATIKKDKNELIKATMASCPVGVEITVAAWDMGNFARILVDGRDHSPDLRGFNVVVVNPISEDVEYVRHFDSGIKEQFSRYMVIGKILPDRIVTHKDFQKEDLWHFNADFKTIDCSLAENDHFFIKGWGDGEEFGRWAITDKAAIAVHFEDVLLKRMIVEAFPYPVKGKTQVMKVRLNGADIGLMELGRKTNLKAKDFILPQEHVKPGLNLISFDFVYAVSPASQGQSQDTRTLSAAFKKIEFGPPE